MNVRATTSPKDHAMTDIVTPVAVEELRALVTAISDTRKELPTARAELLATTAAVSDARIEAEDIAARGDAAGGDTALGEAQSRATAGELRVAGLVRRLETLRAMLPAAIAAATRVRDAMSEEAINDIEKKIAALALKGQRLVAHALAIATVTRHHREHTIAMLRLPASFTPGDRLEVGGLQGQLPPELPAGAAPLAELADILHQAELLMIRPTREDRRREVEAMDTPPQPTETADAAEDRAREAAYFARIGATPDGIFKGTDVAEAA